ncbi:unnamed protein product [Mytilus coruscus]|uniref:Uncharacterized protein n=1 Tax=Mytilus coruscus TaxID=42192 RepID=A0A6J8ANV2_MYTCO|nr:unnamed protein product [Mytilus coruscus]
MQQECLRVGEKDLAKEKPGLRSVYGVEDNGAKVDMVTNASESPRTGCTEHLNYNYSGDHRGENYQRYRGRGPIEGPLTGDFRDRGRTQNFGETGTEGQVPVTQVRPTNVDRKVRKRKRRRKAKFKEGVTGLRVSSSGSEVAKKEITDVPDTPVERWQSPDPKVKVKGVSSMVVQGQIEGTPVNWKIDTGAKSTFITNETFNLTNPSARGE